MTAAISRGEATNSDSHGSTESRPTVKNDASSPALSVGRDSVEPKSDHGSTETEQIKSGPLGGLSRPNKNQTLPASFHDLALQVAFAIYQDIHIKGAGLVFFALLGYGALHPETKEPCQQLAALAGTYLFGAAINRSTQ
jgi:hypothetical protein